MKKRQPIVCFMGLDGSGKSTSIDFAYQNLKAEGVRVQIVRAAYVVKFLALPIKLGKKILMKKNSDPYGGNYKLYLENMRKNAKNGWTYKIFSFLTSCEFKMQIFFNIKVKHAFGKLLLVDRYIYDNAVTYAANLGLGEEYMKSTIQNKWKRAPRPDLIIYIKTPVAVCCSRKNDIPDPLYLEIREPLYDMISGMYPTVTISGNQDKDAMLSQVMDAINSVR